MYIDVIHKALILNNAESIAKKEGSGIFDMLIHDKIEELVHCY